MDEFTHSGPHAEYGFSNCFGHLNGGRALFQRIGVDLLSGGQCDWLDLDRGLFAGATLSVRTGIIGICHRFALALLGAGYAAMTTSRSSSVVSLMIYSPVKTIPIRSNGSSLFL